MKPSCGPLLLLLLFSTIACQGCCQSLVGTLFKSIEEIENVTTLHHEALHTHFGEQWLFPSVRFSTNGTIIGWRFASANNAGRGTPRLSVWSRDPQDPDLFLLQDSMLMQHCVMSEAVLASGEEARFHIGGPILGSEGLAFKEGDIIGILFRSRNVASFTPYLYNTSIINPFRDTVDNPLGYYISTRSQRTQLSLQNSNLVTAALLPLLALDICITNPENDSSVQICTGNDTIDWEADCEGPTSSTELTTGTDANSTMWTMMSIRSTPAESIRLRIVIVTVPASTAAIIVFVCLVMIIGCSCVCWKRSKERKTTQTTDIPLESVVHNSDVTTIDHTYDSLRLDHSDTAATSFIVSVTDEVSNGNRAQPNSGTLVSGNGFDVEDQPLGVGTYERPIFSQSQHDTSVETHAYAQIKPTNKHLKVGSRSRANSALPELPNSYAIHQLSPLAPQLPHPYSMNNLSPLMPRTPLPPTTPTTTTLYNSLDNGFNLSSPLASPLTLSSVVTHGKPAVAGSSTPKGSPDTRFRLRSNSQGVKMTNKPSMTSREPATPTSFFSLETGVYVPTQDQRDLFGGISSASEPLFDDTVYACLSQAANSPFVNNWNFFEESESYWVPASDSKALYEQLSHKKYREIHRKQIEITGHLGSGQFGKVAKGVWHTEQGDLDIAVKMLNKQSSERGTVRFLQEAAIMGQFKHPNIVRLHGVVTVGNPVMIVLELMQNGDLRNYLKSLRPVPGEMVPGDLPRRLLDFCSQIALGMEYLSRKEFVHRDLATRNILLTEDYVCKIADFGMSRDLDDKDYYMSEGGMVPIKWTAPEALNYRRYSTASDVWSYGTLMYEVWSLGQMPFKGKTAEETMSLVEDGHRLPPPPGCPRALYQLMIQCWHPDHTSRPTFTTVVQNLSKPEEELLQWTPEDSNIHPQVKLLGAPREIGEKLYPELWRVYITNTTE